MITMYIIPNGSGCEVQKEVTLQHFLGKELKR